MFIILGIVITLWGLGILYSVFFKMKKKDYSNKTDSSEVFEEIGAMFYLLKIFPWPVVKAVIIVIGFSFVISGIIILIVS
ncbi:hypothetical protein ACFFGV_07430 [Pontibacillus salicampi]|uniref:DUF3784 domain-containing protein n=1 Tax=Pontibacillus salicampi TaxID=1449801 RepID=A0ABV6LM80_9BACI